MAKEKKLYYLADEPKDVYTIFYNAATSIFPGARIPKSMPRGYEVCVTVRGSQMCCLPKFREVIFTYNKKIGQGLIYCMTHKMRVQQSIATVESLFNELQKIKKTFTRGYRKIEVKVDIHNPISVTADGHDITKEF